MRVFIVIIIAAWLYPCGAPAAVQPLPGLPDPAFACRAAVAAAERAEAIPGRLLWAIALTESGRWDPRRRARFAWPWTINAEGQGHFFPTKDAAITAARALQARGVRSMDVGCLQVNLHHHPRAFVDLEDAFDPVVNAAYAARFLRSLYALTGSWVGAAGRYHSATPELGGPYRDRVVALWTGERDAPWPEPDEAGMAEMAATAGSGRLRSGPTAGAGANQPPPGRAMVAPIDPERMARIILARRSQMRDAAPESGGRLLALGGTVERPRSVPRLLSASAVPTGTQDAGARHFVQPFAQTFAKPVGSAFGTGSAGPVLRDARAEAAFAERRSEALRQWRSQGPPAAGRRAPILLRGSSPPGLASTSP
jgi:hypothetical protein